MEKPDSELETLFPENDKIYHQVPTSTDQLTIQQVPPAAAEHLHVPVDGHRRSPRAPLVQVAVRVAPCHDGLGVARPAQRVGVRDAPAPRRQFDAVDVVVEGVAEAQVGGAQQAVLGAVPGAAGGLLAGGQGGRPEADGRHAGQRGERHFGGGSAGGLGEGGGHRECFVIDWALEIWVTFWFPVFMD